MSLDLIIKAETEGLDTMDEALELADFVHGAGLHRSTGSWGRFLRDMAARGWLAPTHRDKRDLQHGNRLAREGCTRCHCGCKYWEHDRCVDCGTEAWDDLVIGGD